MREIDILDLAQLYATAMASKNSTGGGEGVEVLKNEPYEKPNEKGQYTHKIYRLASRVPAWVRTVAPAGALDLYEEVSLLNVILDANVVYRHGMHILTVKLVSSIYKGGLGRLLSTY